MKKKKLKPEVLKMPANVESYILNKCKEGKGILTLKDANNNIIGSLEFDEEGRSKTLTEKFSVVGYINRLVKYSKKDIRVEIDGTLIDRLPISLEHKTIAVSQVDHQGS